jgi:hypothetical protein
MIMLSSLAALALGAAPVQSQTPVQPQATTGQAMAAVAAQSTSTAPAKPVWKPKPKSWTVPDSWKPAAKPLTQTL